MHVEMISDEQKERVGFSELFCRIDRGSVAERLGLLDELQTRSMAAGGERVSFLVSGRNDYRDFLHAGLKNFLDDNLKRGFGRTVPVHQCLQRQRTLVRTGRGNDRFL